MAQRNEERGSVFPSLGIQPKLRVGKADDVLEDEADAVADRVMRMPEPASAEPTAAVGRMPPTLARSVIQPKCATCEHDELQRETEEESVEENEDLRLQRKELAVAGAAPPIDPPPRSTVALPMLSLRSNDARPFDTLRRACKSCEEEDELQRKEDDDELDQAVPAGFESRLRALRSGGGRRLPDATLQFMESRFGADLSNIRVHADGEASTLAKQVNAKAFTLGHDIVFGEGMFQPRTFEGKRLLAHELAHTVQQGATAPVLRRFDDDDEAQETDDRPSGYRATRVESVVVACGAGNPSGGEGSMTLIDTAGKIIDIIPLSSCKSHADPGLRKRVKVVGHRTHQGEDGQIIENTNSKSVEFINIVDGGTAQEYFTYRYDPNKASARERSKNPYFHFEFDKYDTPTTVLLILNPHLDLFDKLLDARLVKNDADDYLGLNDRAQALAVAELTNVGEIRALISLVDHKLRHKIILDEDSDAADERDRLEVLKARLERQLLIAENQRERALAGDDFGIDPHVSERVEDYEDLRPVLDRYRRWVHDFFARHADLGIDGVETGDVRALNQVAASFKSFKKVTDLMFRTDDYDAALQSRMLSTSIELLKKLPAAYDHVASNPAYAETIANLRVERGRILASARVLEPLPFFELGAKRDAKRQTLEKEWNAQARVFDLLVEGAAKNPKRSHVGGQIVVSHETAPAIVEAVEDFDADTKARLVAAALTDLQALHYDLYTTIMAKGHLVHVLSEKGILGLAGNFRAPGEGFWAGIVAATDVLREEGELVEDWDLDGMAKLENFDDFYAGYALGWAQGVKQAAVDLVEMLKVDTWVALGKAIASAFDEAARYQAGFALAIAYNKLKGQFNSLEGTGKAEKAGILLGRLAAEIAIEIASGRCGGGRRRNRSRPQAGRFCTCRIHVLARLTISKGFSKLKSALKFLTGETLRRAARLVEMVDDLLPNLSSAAKARQAGRELSSEATTRVERAVDDLEEATDALRIIQDSPSPEKATAWYRAAHRADAAADRLAAELSSQGRLAETIRQPAPDGGWSSTDAPDLTRIEAGRGKHGTSPSSEVKAAELRLVEKLEARVIRERDPLPGDPPDLVENYDLEVELPNGHYWRRRRGKDGKPGKWCRFSGDPTDCETTAKPQGVDSATTRDQAAEANAADAVREGRLKGSLINKTDAQLRALLDEPGQAAWGMIRDAHAAGKRKVKLPDGTVLRVGDEYRQRGPALALVVDMKTGRIFYGQNTGRIPKDLSEPLAERTKKVVAANEARSPAPPPQKPGWSRKAGLPGSHAEVLAADKALKNRPGAVIEDLAIYVIRTEDITLERAPFMPRCFNCKPITEGARALTD